MNPLELEADHAARQALVADHRRDINRIDRTIVALLGERLRLRSLLGEIKDGRFSSQSAERIYSAIIAQTIAAQDDGHD